MTPEPASSTKPTRGALVNEALLTLPSLAWLAVFFFIPALIVILLGLKPADSLGGVGSGWTLENFRSLADLHYRPIFWRTLWISGVTTVICVGIALPVSFGMACSRSRWRQVLLLLIIVPFWTNFLIRVFAWKSLLQADGLVSQLIDSAHLFEESPAMLYNSGAVLLIMVYTQLPFAILPLYAAAEKFDFTLLEAARDLGASKLHAFWTVFIPGVSRGLGVAALIVFVATIGMYVVPDIVGGVDSEMIGNKIVQRVQSDRNLPLASALASAMLFCVIVLMLAARWSASRRPGHNSVEP